MMNYSHNGSKIVNSQTTVEKMIAKNLKKINMKNSLYL